MQCARHVLIIHQRYITQVSERLLHQLHERYFDLFENARETRFSRVKDVQTIAKDKSLSEHQQVWILRYWGKILGTHNHNRRRQDEPSQNKDNRQLTRTSELKRLCKRLGTNPKLFTTWHLETNEQTENANVDLKTYLRVYVNYKQNDWVDYLFVAEFEVNSAKSATTSMKLFLATKGYFSRSEIKLLKSIVIDNFVKRKKIRSANKLITKLKNLREFLRVEIKWIQSKQKKYANRHRASTSKFRVKNMIMLNVRFQITRRQNKFLDYKNLKSYRVIKKINNITYELELSVTMTEMFSVFHSWLLHLNDGDSFRDQRTIESKLMKTEEDEWEINDIMESKINKRRNDSKIEAKERCFRYLVRWIEHDNDNTTSQWLNWTKVKNCLHAVINFHYKNSRNVESHASFVISKNWTSSTWDKRRRKEERARKCWISVKNFEHAYVVVEIKQLQRVNKELASSLRSSSFMNNVLKHFAALSSLKAIKLTLIEKERKSKKEIQIMRTRRSLWNTKRKIV